MTPGSLVVSYYSHHFVPVNTPWFILNEIENVIGLPEDLSTIGVINPLQ